MVETLTTKLARLGAGRLALVFSNGRECNISDSKRAADFKAKMDEARPDLGSPATDMSTCLDDIVRSQYAKGPRNTTRRLTMFILTDGLWGVSGNLPQEDMDKQMVEFIKKFKPGKSLVGDRWFSIQIISFATDSRAQVYLKYLESGLWKDHGIK